MWKTILNQYTWDFDWFDEKSYEQDLSSIQTKINNNTLNITTITWRVITLETAIENLEQWTFEQWIWLLSTEYIYVIYWVDWAWIVIRDTLDLITQTSTWPQIWTKPTTLTEVELLTYT